jgi:hypothetical protein
MNMNMSDNSPSEGGSSNIPLIPAEIPSQELQYFKEKVKRWLMIDKQVADLEGQIKEIKKVKKELMPEITKFMVQYNIADLNTEDGKLKCSERKTKQAINKNYLIQELTNSLGENQEQINKCMDNILLNRQIKITHILRKCKK